MENPSYYAVLPANIRYNKEITMFEKLLYAEITALTQKDGYCRASNSYFAKLYDCHITTISRAISDLEKKGFLKLEIEVEKGNQRKIFIGEIVEKKAKTVNTPISKNANTYKQKCLDPISKNAKHNNINIINKKNNNKSKDLLLQKKEKNFIEKVKENLNQDDLAEYKDEFGLSEEQIKNDLKAFIIYWSQKNEKGQKELWQKKETFCVKSRFWHRLNNGYSRKNKKEKEILIL